MNFQKPHQKRSGFTLVELLVVIVIVAVLASLTIMFTKRASLSTRRAAETNNIRQVGLGVTSLAADYGYYPMGWDSNQGKSWASLMVDELNGKDSSVRQVKILWSPILERNIPLNEKLESVTHFGCNPAIMTDTDDSSSQDPKPPKFKIRNANLRRPAEQVLLAGANPRNAKAEFQRAHSVMWQMRSRIGGNGGSNSPPRLDRSNARSPIDFPSGIADSQQYGSLPDFYRGGDGKALFLFVDGHAERLAPDEVLEKHFAVSY